MSSSASGCGHGLDDVGDQLGDRQVGLGGDSEAFQADLEGFPAAFDEAVGEREQRGRRAGRRWPTRYLQSASTPTGGPSGVSR